MLGIELVSTERANSAFNCWLYLQTHTGLSMEHQVSLNGVLCVGCSFLTFHSWLPQHLKVCIHPEKKKLQSNSTLRNTLTDMVIPSVHCAFLFFPGEVADTAQGEIVYHSTLQVQRSNHTLGTQYQYARPLQNARIFERNCNNKIFNQNKRQNEIFKKNEKHKN